MKNKPRKSLIQSDHVNITIHCTVNPVFKDYPWGKIKSSCGRCKQVIFDQRTELNWKYMKDTQQSLHKAGICTQVTSMAQG